MGGGGQDVETTTVVAGDSAVAGQTVRVKSDQRNLSLLLAARSPGSASVCLSVCLSICLSAVYMSVCLSAPVSLPYPQTLKSGPALDVLSPRSQPIG